MTDDATFHVLAFQRRAGTLQPQDLIDCGSDEDRAFRIGREMAHRVSGVAFFRIDTSASGDQWTEVELLCATGDVPIEDAA
jgi:hypothetical protein